ncbi:MAG: alpha-ketoacid dehydrogenase subunit beta [Acidimicrobiia bacterium]
MSEWRYMDAVGEALAAEMRDDETVFLAGVDVDPGVFAVTAGLMEEFGPDRVRNTPISEMGLLGVAVGAALAGYRPVVELMFMDFIGVAFDPLLNQAAKLRYMTGGAAHLPLVVRTQTGAGGSGGAQHSQSLEAIVAHIPGLTVLMPSTPSDAAAQLRGAIQDPRPTVFVEHRRLYGWREPRPTQLPAPEAPGKAVVRRHGTDLTIVSWGRMAVLSLQAAEELATEGIDAEVVDVRSLVPLDMATIAASVAATGRLLVVHEAVRSFGGGAEIVARICEETFWSLDAPPMRIGGPDAPIPFSPGLEQSWIPDILGIAQAARRLCDI